MIVSYDVIEFIDKLCISKKELLIREVLKCLDYYLLDLKKISSYIFRRTYWISGLLKSIVHEVKDIVENSLNDNFLVLLKTVKKELIDVSFELFTIDEAEKLVVIDYMETIINEVERVCFNIFASDIAPFSTVEVNELKDVYLFSKHNRSFNYQVTGHSLSNLMQKYGFSKDKSVAYNGLKMYKHFKTKLVSNKSNLIDLRILFYSDFYFPSMSVVKEFLIDSVEENMINLIIFPLFLDGSSNLFSTKSHGYFRIFYEYKLFYQELVDYIYQESRVSDIYVVIPNMMDYNVYLKWRNLIKTRSNNLLRVGIILDDFDLLDDIEEYDLLDCIVIDIDYLNRNINDNSTLTTKIFVDNFLPDLRIIRSRYLKKDVKLIISSKYMKSNEIMDKLLIAGYKNFILNEQNFDNIAGIADKYWSKRQKSNLNSMIYD